MIEIVNAYTRSGNEWCTCCQKQTDTKRIKFSQDGNQGISVVLCNDCIKELINTLEQEPKTVLYSGDGYADGHMVYDMAECPNCGYEYEDGDKDWGENFCPHCGQPLKWESEG